MYEVIGWRLRWNDTALAIHQRVPDRRWFGSEPELLAERRGDGVDALIERIDRTTRAYPYGGEYRLWPGPNSNTFTAWVGRAVPELELDLPPTAIGKDYLGDRLLARAPSGFYVLDDRASRPLSPQQHAKFTPILTLGQGKSWVHGRRVSGVSSRLSAR